MLSEHRTNIRSMVFLGHVGRLAVELLITGSIPPGGDVLTAKLVMHRPVQKHSHLITVEA